MKSREYFTDLAKELPQDTVIMASGCAKYRYNKLALGFKGVRIGPTLPAFVSENVKQKIIEAFDLKATTEVKPDLAEITA